MMISKIDYKSVVDKSGAIVQVIETQYFSMMLRPPGATLFPYTTLFRSAEDLDRPDGRPGCAPRRRDAALHAQDRKSTRLNSSHSQISYADFCLKKKNA